MPNADFRPILVMGDFLHQHVVSEQAERLNNPNVPRETYTEFEIFSGSFLFEHLSHWCLQYAHLKNPENEKRVTRKVAFRETKDLVHGPSTLVIEVNSSEVQKRKGFVFDIARKEHISIKKTRPNEGERGYESFRISRNLGRSNFEAQTLKRNLRSFKPGVILLSVDFHTFLRHDFGEYFDGEKPKLEGLPMAVRITVGPDVDPHQDVFTDINANISNLAQRCGGNNRIAIISSGSLRACGHDISFRKAWERTISDTVTALRSVANSAGTQPSCLSTFDWVVVTYYNDACLAVPISALRLPNAEDHCHFVAEPFSIERDLSLKFSAHTKGTETLVTQAIAFELSCHSDQPLISLLNRAMVHGLKASRYLQLRGYCRLKVGGDWTRVAANENLTSSRGNREDFPVEAVVERLSDRERDVFDVKMYLWNRSRSSDYFQRQDRVLLRKTTPKDPKKDTVIAATWPFGDLVEIICEGLPLHGSFPPIALKLDDGRERIEKSVEKTARAYSWAGWLESTQIPLGLLEQNSEVQAKDILRLKPAAHDRKWWSFEELFIRRISEKLVWTKSYLPFPEARMVFAEYLFGVAIVRFGEQYINRSGRNPQDSYELKLLAILFSNCADAFPTKWRGFEMRNLYYSLDPVATFNAFFPNISDRTGLKSRRSTTGTLEDLRTLLKKTRAGAHFDPSASTVQGLLPYLRIGKLNATSRREIQSFRDIKERIATYRDSETQRPLSLAVFGPPGSGKSFGVKQILSEAFPGKSEIHEFNLAGINSPELLSEFFMRLQDSHLKGNVPVAFWDEYDTALGGNALGWLPHFLGPMQDNQFVFKGHLRRLPKCYFIFAGSMFSSFGEMMLLDAASRGREAITVATGLTGHHMDSILATDEDTVGKFRVRDWRDAKGTDFKSRLGGVLDIGGIEAPAETIVVRQANHTKVGTSSEDSSSSPFVRKARAIRTHLEARFGKLKLASGELLIRDNTICSLLQEESYAHGLRSIENIVSMFAAGGRDIIDSSVVPTGDQRRIHMSVDAFDEV